jgi:uncharacterized DUF497 family protein
MIRFEWDPMKARTNQQKHGITFDDAMGVFEDPHALFEQDRTGGAGEFRWQAIGLAGGGGPAVGGPHRSRGTRGRSCPLDLGPPSHPEGAKPL